MQNPAKIVTALSAPCSVLAAVAVLAALTFLKAFNNFFRSYSAIQNISVLGTIQQAEQDAEATHL